MRCPQCLCLEDKVNDSRMVKDGTGVRRRRECSQCGHRFTTYETIIHAELKVIKKNGDLREEFDRSKIRAGIEKACWKRPISGDDIERITENVIRAIETDFDKEVMSEVIGKRVMEALKNIDEVAYVRFASVYRSFKDIEEFIEEIKILGKKPKGVR
jgi:transcriptional repressor NrdR